MHVIGGQVGQRPASVVLVLDPHQPGLAGRQRRVAAAAGLDGSLLVRADHELPPGQPPSLEDPGVEVQHHRRFDREVRVPGEDPRPIKPRADGIRSQRPPHRGRRDERHHPRSDQLPGQLGATPTRQRHAGGGRQLARQRFDLGVHRGGKDPGPARFWAVLQPFQALFEEPSSANGAPPAGWYRAALRSPRSPSPQQPAARSWPVPPARTGPCKRGPVSQVLDAPRRSRRSRTDWHCHGPRRPSSRSERNATHTPSPQHYQITSM